MQLGVSKVIAELGFDERENTQPNGRRIFAKLHGCHFSPCNPTICLAIAASIACIKTSLACLLCLRSWSLPGKSGNPHFFVLSSLGTIPWEI